MSILELYPISIFTQSLEQSDLKNVSENSIDYSIDFPFLNDEITINFIRNSKIMFINRGLPGSGKSTLSSRINSVYETAVICSADDFFMDKNGNYNFDINKRPLAHEMAQKKAKQSCHDSISPVIIDNTNLMYWEIKNYLNIARDYEYIVLLIEPRTLKKFDAHYLFMSNKHSVSFDQIQLKINQYETVLPYFFGWFLNLDESAHLINVSKNILKEATQVLQDFNKDLNNKLTNLEFLNFRNGILHCTTKFIGKNKKTKEVLDYVNNPLISLSMAKVFKLKIAGFSITQSTIAAHIKLDDEIQKVLWNNQATDEDLNDIFLHKKLRTSNKFKVLNELAYGANAHITLGLADKVMAKQSGLDLLRIKLIELQETKKNLINSVKKETNDKIFIYYGEFNCFVKLKTPLQVDAIFSGHF